MTEDTPCPFASFVSARSGSGRGRQDSARSAGRRAASRRRRYASENWYDVWLPNLAPSAPLVAAAQKADTPAAWRRFATRYRAEMARPEAARVLDTLAALSHHTDFSVGCYCENEAHCHRSMLREILKAHGAKITG